MGDSQEHVWLSDIFKITLDLENKCKKFFLSHLYSEGTSDVGEIDMKLSKGLMDTAIMERLGLIGVHSFENYEDGKHSYGLYYLYEIYEDIIEYEKKQEFSRSKITYSTEILKYCREIVIQYSITYLIEPDIFLHGDLCWKQFNTIIEKNHVLQYLKDMRCSMVNGPEIKQIFGGIIRIIMDKLVIISIDANILNALYSHLATLVLFYTEDEIMMEVLTSSEVWFGSCTDDSTTLTGKNIENSTILGQLLKASVFTNTERLMNVHFGDFDNMRDFPHISLLLQQQLKQHVTKCSLIVKRLLAKKKFFNKVMIWFHIAIIANIKRNNLGTLFQPNSFNLYSSIGFSVNVLHLVLMIFSPMGNDYQKLCDRVDFRFCIENHTYHDIGGYGILQYGLNDETTMIPRDEHIQQELLHSINGSDSRDPHNFFTEWFFLCPRIIQAMYIPLYENLKHGIRAYEDEQISDQLSQIERDVLFSKNIAKKCVLVDSELKSLLLKYCASFSVYILEKVNFKIIQSLQQPTTQGKGVNGSESCANLPSKKNEVPPVAYCIPDSFIADIATVINFIYNEFVNEYDDSLQPIIILMSLMMGRMNLLKNPHHRAKMAETLAYLNQIPIFGGIKQEYISYIEKTLDSKTPASKILIRIFPKNLLQIFIDIEFTGSASAFHQKFSYRHLMYVLFKLIVKTPPLLHRLKEISVKAEGIEVKELPLFLRFINLLTNDATYLLDEALLHMSKIKEIETLKDSEEWNLLSDDDKKLKDKQLKETIDRSIGYNTISIQTVKALKRITTHIKRPFLTLAMKDKLAAMLNYFYFQLVSNKQSKLKVKNMEKLKFDPKKLLIMISIIYSNFEDEPMFIEAVASDERSYSSLLFEKAITILKKINCPYQIIKSIESIEKMTNDFHLFKSANDINLDDCPDEFLDLISCEIMRDPVLLPTSHVILDRNTITRQLLSGEFDPFNRAPLTIDQVVPQVELKKRIDEWIKSKRSLNENNQKS